MSPDSKLMHMRPSSLQAKRPRRLPGYIYETRIGDGAWTRPPEIKPMHQDTAARAGGKAIRILISTGYEASVRLVQEGEFDYWW